MPRYTGKVRRLADLRSVGGRSGNGTKFPHEIYMRLCCLEMERFRREQEQNAAMSRAHKCMDRCHHIEVEVQDLLRSIGQLPVSGSASVERSEPEVAPAREAGKFMFTY